MPTIKIDDEVVARLREQAGSEEYYSDIIGRVLKDGVRRPTDGPINFGDVVQVAATAHRVIREDPGPADSFHNWSSYPIIYHGRGENISREVGETGNWPPRDGRDYARVCRKVLPEPVYGVVVGKTLRVEGRPESSYSADGKEGWLEDRHPVRVYEVALARGWERKARIVLALVDDIEKVDKRVEEL